MVDEITLKEEEAKARVIMNTKMQAVGSELKRIVDIVAEGVAVKHSVNIQTQLTVKIEPRIALKK